MLYKIQCKFLNNLQRPATTTTTITATAVTMHFSYSTPCQSIMPRLRPPDKWACYMICCGARTYIGKTNNLRRRLRQHNGQLVGGAKATRRGGGPWRLVWYVRGFASNSDVLKFEWRCHNPPRRRFGIEGRTQCLLDVCRLPRWTSTAPPSRSVPLHVRVVAGAASTFHRITAGRLPPQVTWSQIPQIPSLPISNDNGNGNSSDSHSAQ